jgi:hypothetical protein
VQYACATLPSVACPAVQNFSTLYHKWHHFRKTVFGHKIRVLIFSTTFVRNIFVLRRIERDRIKNKYWSPCIVPVILLLRYYGNWNFLNRFSKNTQMPNIMKILPVGANFFHADRETDSYDEVNSCFSHFCGSA